LPFHILCNAQKREIDDKFMAVRDPSPASYSGLTKYPFAFSIVSCSAITQKVTGINRPFLSHSFQDTYNWEP